MKKRSFIYSFLVILLGVICFSFILKIDNYSNNNKQIVIPIDKNQLIRLTNKDDDSLFVINFWATWCAPCVAELPYFNAAHKKYNNSKSKMSMKLVSMDFDDQLEKRVIPFFQRKKNSDYAMNKYLITSMDYDNWMPEIDKGWSGSIPATLFYNKTKNIYHFHEGDYNQEELFHTIDSLLTL